MNKTRGRIYWIIFVIFILVFILLAISHQQAAAEMAADRRYSFSLTLEPYDPSRQSASQSQQESMYLSAWIVGFIIPAALMLISYFIHGCIYYNDKLDYIVDHEKPSYTRMMIQLLIAFMFIMITGTTVWNSFYTLLLLISPVLFLLYPIIIIFFFNSGTVLCNAILIPAENDDENTEYFQ